MKAAGTSSALETAIIALVASILGAISAYLSVHQHLVMLDRDALGRLGMARFISDHRVWTPTAFGPLWLPLPQLLMAPFAVKLSWWHSGLAAAIPSTICFILTIVAVYRLARYLMPLRWAIFAAAIPCFNPNLLYLDTTPMSEPISIALSVWVVLALVTFMTRIAKRERVTGQLLWLGGIAFAADLTRYDAWILGVGVWCLVVWSLCSHRVMKQNVAPFLGFTVLSALAPALWMLYSKVFWGSWINFLTGPYTVKSDVLRIFPPGTQQYYGWHNPLQAIFLYVRTAQLIIAAHEWGYLVTFAAVAGTILMLRRRIHRTALLLWLPLPFYVYGLVSGAPAMVLPDMGPFHFIAWIRYGAQLMPALAIFSALLLSVLAEWLRQRTPQFEIILLSVASAALIASSFVILRNVPILLQDTEADAHARLAVIQPILMKFVGADQTTPVMVDVWTTDTGMTIIQDESIPLRNTIGPYDGPIWDSASKSPATRVAWVVAADNSQIAAAVDAHPEHLRLVSKACAPTISCVRLFKSEIYGQTRK